METFEAHGLMYKTCVEGTRCMLQQNPRCCTVTSRYEQHKTVWEWWRRG